MRTGKPILVAALAAWTLGTASVAQAALVTLAGTDFDFTFDDAAMGLYGVPTVSGNSLVFMPSGFVADPDEPGFADVNDTVNITIVVTAKGPGLVIGPVSYQESGVYTLIGSGAADPLDDPRVTVSGQIRLTAGLDEVTDPIVETAPFVAGATGAPWTATAAANMAPFAATTVLVTLENILSAEWYLDGDDASIEKTGASLTVEAVPLPAAVWLLGPALAGLGLARRRRSLAGRPLL